MTRYELLRLITMYLTNGRNIRVNVDGHDIHLEWSDKRPYVIWHDRTDGSIAAIIYEEDQSELDQMSVWAEGKVEY